VHCVVFVWQVVSQRCHRLRLEITPHGACPGWWQPSCGSFIKICKQFRGIKTLEIIQRQVWRWPSPLCPATPPFAHTHMTFRRIFHNLQLLEHWNILQYLPGPKREPQWLPRGIVSCCSCSCSCSCICQPGPGSRNKQTTTGRQQTHWERIYLSLITRRSLWWMPEGNFIISIYTPHRCQPQSRWRIQLHCLRNTHTHMHTNMWP